MEFKFSKLVKSLCLGVSEPEPTKQHTLCVTDKVNRHSSKKIKKRKEKNGKNKSNSVKSLRYMGEFFSRLMASHYLIVASYI